MIVKHDPENGSWGDCTRACVASIFNLPAESVPHFCEGGELPPDAEGYMPWERRLRSWLAERGYGLLHIQFNDRLDAGWQQSLQFHYVRGGKTSRGTNHDTVYFGDSLVHDPRSDQPIGILKDVFPQWVMIFVKL